MGIPWESPFPPPAAEAEKWSSGKGGGGNSDSAGANLADTDPLLKAIVSRLASTPGSRGSGGSGAGGSVTAVQRRASSSMGVNLPLWTVDFSSIAIKRQIGEGSFGKVRPTGLPGAEPL